MLIMRILIRILSNYVRVDRVTRNQVERHSLKGASGGTSLEFMDLVQSIYVPTRKLL
ncbi:hypothetical protein L3N51_01161 [Metallosphaera sp. J1]|nr:hypothetical protein [Metallosphaera javensis (ex Hofmann et al. 2022)]